MTKYGDQDHNKPHQRQEEEEEEEEEEKKRGPWTKTWRNAFIWK